MFSQLGPIEISCDAPPYAIVEACEQVGFETPLDVRWSRMSHFLSSRGSLGGLPWKLFGSNLDSLEKKCHCGGPLPLLEKYTFMFASEKLADYMLGQCARCRTVFWEDA